MLRTSDYPRYLAKAPNREGQARHLNGDSSTPWLDRTRKDGGVFHYTVFKKLLSRKAT